MPEYVAMKKGLYKANYNIFNTARYVILESDREIAHIVIVMDRQDKRGHKIADLTWNMYDYWVRCAHHDYWYSYSEDGDVWRAGQSQEDLLKQIAKALGGMWERIHDAWMASHQNTIPRMSLDEFQTFIGGAIFNPLDHTYPEPLPTE